MSMPAATSKENSHPVVENGGDTSYEKLESMATWVGTSISSAFFASLGRFSCINLSTSDHDEEIEEEAKDIPLVHSSQNSSDYRSDEPSFAGPRPLINYPAEPYFPSAIGLM